MIVSSPLEILRSKLAHVPMGPNAPIARNPNQPAETQFLPLARDSRNMPIRPRARDACSASHRELNRLDRRRAPDVAFWPVATRALL